MKELKYFSQLNDYTTKKDDFEYPTVSYVEENTKVYYKEHIIVIYTTTGTSQNIRLINRQDYLDYIKIVETGEELPTNELGAVNYTFANPGEHKVELKFRNYLTSLEYAFEGCYELTRIPNNLFGSCIDVTSFYSTFNDCSGLTGSIPDSLFSNNTAVTDFSQTFSNCSGLTSIPANLFSNNTAVTNFTNTFSNCSGLTGRIPENLFSNNTKVTDFSATFSYCSGLTGSIPENLFSNNTAVTNFGHTFDGCTGLTSIPENLFSNNTAVTSFDSTFNNCSGLTGNVPVDSDGTPIYNRSGSGKPGYAIVTDYYGCFQGCTGLTDYSSIPVYWN